MHCGVTLSYQFLPYLPSWVPVTKTRGGTPIPYPLAPDRESCRVSQSPIDFMACQSLPCPVDSIAQCGISLPQEVGGQHPPQPLALTMQQDPGLSLALMGAASFSLDFSISILPYNLWPKAGWAGT